MDEHPFRNYLYTRDKDRRGENDYWRCSDRKSDCQARFVLFQENYFRITALHICKEDLKGKFILKMPII
jgi:hypothetical protein